VFGDKLFHLTPIPHVVTDFFASRTDGKQTFECVYLVKRLAQFGDQSIGFFFESLPFAYRLLML